MKKLTVMISVCLMTLMMSSVQARDTRHMYSLADALGNSNAKVKIGGDIKFYFGEKSHSNVIKQFGEYQSNKKTNAFNKSDKVACEWAFLSAMLSFQDRARSLGANAVINIKSYYKKNTVSSATEYECGAGGIIAGVTFRGDFVKLGNRTSSYTSPSSSSSSSSSTSNLTYSDKTKQAQLRLQSLGYNAGGADGFYGNRSRNAVRQFQTDKSINTTGELDEETLALLGVKQKSTEPSQIKSNQTNTTQVKQGSEIEEPANTGKVITKGTTIKVIDNTFVFAAHDSLSEMTATLNKGTSVTVLQKLGDWSLIQSGDIEGYVYTEDLGF